MRFLIIAFLLFHSLVRAQSIVLTPNRGIFPQLTSTKVGSNNMKIEGTPVTDILNYQYANGDASISLIGGPNYSTFITASANLSLNFFHGTTKRFSILDDYYYNFDTETSSLKIQDRINNSTTYTPFEIVKGSNTVTLNNLAIKSMSSSNDEGRFLKIGSNGNVESSPNQFEILGALDLTTLSGSFTKNLLGSYGSDGSSQVIHAPVHLPNGSKIKKIVITYKDFSSTDGLAFSLRRHNGSSESNIAMVASTNITLATNTTMQPNTYSNSIIDNTIFQYYLVISPCNQANTNTGAWDNQNIKFVKATIEYL